MVDVFGGIPGISLCKAECPERVKLERFSIPFLTKPWFWEHHIENDPRA